MIDSEAIYCLYTNKISINALVFILYHELGHSFYGRVYDIDDIKRYEQDADNFAVDLMKDPNEDNTFFSANFGIVVALCSNLFLHPTPLKLSSDSHPDTDVRILNAIDRIVEKGEWAYKNYLNFVAIIFRMFGEIETALITKSFIANYNCYLFLKNITTRRLYSLISVVSPATHKTIRM